MSSTSDQQLHACDYGFPMSWLDRLDLDEHTLRLAFRKGGLDWPAELEC